VLNGNAEQILHCWDMERLRYYHSFYSRSVSRKGRPSSRESWGMHCWVGNL